MHGSKKHRPIIILWQIALIQVVFLLVIPGGGMLSVKAKGPNPNLDPNPDRSPIVIGHQGAAGLAPGNTLAGIALAIHLGVDAIELDVLLSVNGILVLHHDFMLHPEKTRTSNGLWLQNSDRLAIKNMTVNQLKTYDVGRLKPGSKSARNHPDQAPVDGQRIPTLQEVLDVIKQSGSNGPELYIEIKTDPDHADVSPSPQLMADTLVQLLEKNNVADKCKILSFDWRALARVMEIAPTIETVHLTSHYKQLKMFDKQTTLLWTGGIDPDDFNRSLPAMIKAAGGSNWGAKYSEIWQSHVNQAHKAGLKVYVWTVDSASDMRHFIDIGVDGIITNRPDILKELLAKSNETLTFN